MIMDRQAYLFNLNSAYLWMIFWKVIRTIGPSDYWAIGLLNNSSFGLLTLRTIGLSDYQAFGRLGLRTIGPIPIENVDSMVKHASMESR